MAAVTLMTAEQGTAFLSALGVKNINVKGNGWIEASCPLAKWLHKHHTDATPSFGLSINPGERSYFLCFACRQGSAEELLHIIEMYDKGQGQYDFALPSDSDGWRLRDVTSRYAEFGTARTATFVEWPR